MMALLPRGVLGADFAVGVAPPHFELRGEPGSVVRDVLLMLNTANEFGDYRVRSADWSMDENGGVTIHGPELLESSCRPWVRIERHKVSLEPLGTRNYRFEIHIPENAAETECRFALLISQALDENVGIDRERSQNSIRMPIAAQIAVIVYVAVGDAQPELTFLSAGLEDGDKGLLPALHLSNRGRAHGRPFGSLEGVDAAGNRHEFIVTPSPILAGSSGRVPLLYDPSLPTERIVPIVPPLELKGDVEYEQGLVPIEARLN